MKNGTRSSPLECRGGLVAVENTATCECKILDSQYINP